MAVPLSFFSLKLFEKFLINFGSSIMILTEFGPLLEENFQLFFQVGMLLLKIKLSLIIEDFIGLVSLDYVLYNFFLGLSQLN